MAVGYYQPTVATDPQTLCTAFEGETGITSAVALGTVGESVLEPLVPSATAAINDIGDITASDTAITYDTLVGAFPIFGVPFVITIDSEDILIASFTSTVLTVATDGRGWNGTVAAAHLDNAAIAYAGEVLPATGKVIIRVEGGTAANITTAATNVGNVQVADGYPSPA